MTTSKSSAKINNVVVSHRGWTISIADHTGFDIAGKTREIAIWNPADSPNDLDSVGCGVLFLKGDIRIVVYHYGDSAKELVHAIRYAQWQIDKTLFKSWIKSIFKVGD